MSAGESLESAVAAERRCYGAEEIFEFSEGMLEPHREREVREHLGGCSRCRRLHRQELSLSASLHSPGFREESPEPAPEVYEEVSWKVAMALPTRSLGAKAVWGAGAAALLVAALVSLSLHAVQPYTFATHFMGVLWGLTAALSDATGILLTVAGSTIATALFVGAVVDALIAAMLFAVVRWRRPRGA